MRRERELSREKGRGDEFNNESQTTTEPLVWRPTPGQRDS